MDKKRQGGGSRGSGGRGEGGRGAGKERASDQERRGATPPHGDPLRKEAEDRGPRRGSEAAREDDAPGTSELGTGNVGDPGASGVGRRGAPLGEEGEQD